MTARSTPPNPLPPRGTCWWGVTPCGAKPARLYLCGWRCDTHQPANERKASR